MRARGPSEIMESPHFAVRWGAGPGADNARKAAEAVCGWLERCWDVLCNEVSPDFFVLPYSSEGWCADGRMPRRKINVYIGKALAPHPGVGWAHQGTHVESGVEAVRHAKGNREGKLHHSHLALAQGAAENERTVCHEFAHALQMHTGGHLDSKFVGYQWEAHAEYCTHLLRPTDPGWAPHLVSFLETAHLPIDCTNAAEDGGAGRQYIVWPFYCFLDKRFGRGFTHSLWHADRRQRQARGEGSLDMLSNLARIRELEAREGKHGRTGTARMLGARSSARPPTACCQTSLALPSVVSELLRLTRLLARSPPPPSGEDGEADASFLSRLFSQFAAASLTLHWGWEPLQTAALRKAAPPLRPSRFTRLCPLDRARMPGTTAWRPDARRPLKRFGSHTFRLQPTLDSQLLRVSVRCAAGAPPYILFLAIAGVDATTGEELFLEGPAAAGASVCVTTSPRENVAYLVCVCAGTDSFSPCAWGTAPSALQTAKYDLLLDGCRPHPDCEAPPPPRPALTLNAPEVGSLRVPTGLSHLQPEPRPGGGGASLTGRDVRSGQPNQTTHVRLAVQVRLGSAARLSAIRFTYRFLVGYSTNGGDPGPRFELQIARQPEREDVEEGEQEEEGRWRTLYSSPEFAATPFSFDAATGGHPTNYSPPVSVSEALAMDLPPGRYGLRIRFSNGRQNMHLQGAEVGGKCDLGLELGFGVEVPEGDAAGDGGGHDGLRRAEGEAAGGKRSDEAGGDAFLVQRRRVCALLCEAVPGTTGEEAWRVLAAHGWNADAAAATLMGVQDV